MNNDTPQVYEISGSHPMAQSFDRVFLVKHTGGQFNGMLKGIRGKRLLFVMRRGGHVWIHEDEILSAFELPARRP